MLNIKELKKKAVWVRKETLKIHKITPDIRLASSLSPIEILVVLYYGKILKFNPKNLQWQKRDRFIISKPHGAVSMYPILADLGFFNKNELKRVAQNGSFLGGIPDANVPGFETTHGALGHGLGVACGMAIALKRKKSSSKIFVLLGDGELYAGPVWEATMLAAEHKLNNLILIIDDNKATMLDFSKNIIDLRPLSEKFRAFQWETKIVDGHNVKEVYNSLKKLKESKSPSPKVLIANTVKGKGVPRLEKDSLSHIRVLKGKEIDKIIAKLK